MHYLFVLDVDQNKMVGDSYCLATSCLLVSFKVSPYGSGELARSDITSFWVTHLDTNGVHIASVSFPCKNNQLLVNHFLVFHKRHVVFLIMLSFLAIASIDY